VTEGQGTRPATYLSAALRDPLQRVDACLDDRQLLALLHRLRQVRQHVLADVQPDELGEAGDGRRKGPKVVVGQAEGAEAMTVEEGAGQVSDIVAVQMEHLKGPLVCEHIVGDVVERAVAVVKLGHLLLGLGEAGEAGEEGHGLGSPMQWLVAGGWWLVVAGGW
jgi:hypothetical protein